MPARTTGLVGRDQDLAALVGALDQVVDGAPATVLVGGEAGIGKTRLVREFTDRVADRARILAGGCVERGADGLPFAPFTAALRGLTAGLGRTRLDDLLPAGGPGELPRVLPGLGKPDRDTDPGSARARLFEGMLGLLGKVAALQPTALLIEDLHWGAGSSRDLLDFLVRNQPPLLIIVTYRSDELDRTHPLRAMLAELDRVGWVSRRELARLARPEVAALIRGALGEEPRPEFVDLVQRRSEGNPLFVEALLAGGTSGDAALGDAALPESLRDLLLAPVHRLPGQAREVLAVAAAGGVRVGHALLAAVAGVDAPSLSEALRAAVSGNLLVADGDGYAFRHALIRDAVYGDELPGDRVRWHLHYAEALAADPTLAPDGRAATELAHHWHAARDLPRALTAAWRAAADSEELLAYAEALRMLDRVLELWPQVTAPAELIGTDRLAVLERAAEAASRACAPERGVALATTALDELAGDPARAAHLRELRSRMLRALGRPGDLEELREAVRLAPPDHPVKGRVLASLASRLLDVPEHDEARRVAETALDLARAHGDARTEALALLLIATLRARFGHLAAELPRLHEAQRIAESIGAHDLRQRATHAEAHLLEAYGEHERAADVARRGMQAAHETGMVRSHAGEHAVSLANSLTSLGRWDGAMQVIDHAIELMPPPIVRTELVCLRAAIALARGDVELPRNALHAARDVSGGGANLVYPVAGLEIGLLLRSGQASRAVAVAEATLAGRDLQSATRYSWPFLVLAAQAAGAAGRDEQTAVLVAELRAQGEKMQAASPVQQAHQATFGAALAREEGRPDRAAWDAAVAFWEGLGNPYQLAQALLGAAEAAVAADHDRAVAAARLERAARLADGLRAGPLRAAIDRLARRARLPLASAEPAGDPTEQARVRLGLTGRELEVLRLVAAGRNNHDIATELFISAKTASVHISRILAKLGLANRTEAAATAHRLGLS